MDNAFVDRKIKDILTKAKGQGKLTEQAVRTLLARDPQFLQALVDPYLDGIIAHAIERARRAVGSAESSITKKSAALPKKTLPPKPHSAPARALDNLLDAWAKKFDQTPAPPPATKGAKVSSRHLDAMKSLIKKK